MGKIYSTAVGAGIAGAIVGVCAYSYMSPKEQRHIRRGIKNTVEDLKDIADKVTEDM